MSNTWTLSVSQLRKWSDPVTGCQRQFAFDFWGGGEYVQSLGAFRGDLAHEGIRIWGQNQIPPERHAACWAARLDRDHAAALAEKNITAADYADRVVAVVHKMAGLLDRPIWPATHECEKKGKITIEGVPWSTKPDLVTLNAHVDYKVIWAAKEALSEAAIYVAPQPNLYLHAWFQKNTGTDKRPYRFVYGVPGKSPKAFVVETEIRREDAADRVHEMNKVGREIYRVALAKPDPLTLQPNFDACGEFGGCPYREKCGVTATDIVNIDDAKPQRTETTNMGAPSLLSQLTGGKKAETPKAAETPKTPEPKTEDKPSTNDATGSDDLTLEILNKAAKQLKLTIEPHEVVNGLKAMYPKVDVQELGKIVATARTMVPAKETPKVDTSNALPSVMTEPKTEETPKTRTRAPKAETKANDALGDSLSLVAKLAAEIAALPANEETLPERVRLAALLIHGK